MLDLLRTEVLEAVLGSEEVGKVTRLQHDRLVVGAELRGEVRAALVGGELLWFEEEEAAGTKAGVDVAEEAPDALVAPVEMNPLGDAESAPPSVSGLTLESRLLLSVR